MDLLTRQKKDGKRTAGYGAYLLAALFALGSVVYLHHRLAGGVHAAGSKRLAPSNVTPITQPASLISGIEVKEPHPTEGQIPSYRQDQKGSPPPPTKPVAKAAERESFDTINLALREATLTPGSNEGHTDRPMDEGGGPGGAGAPSPFAELPSAFPPEGNVSARETPSRNKLLFSYREGTADVSEPSAGVRGHPASVSSKVFAPRGTLIGAYLLTTVDSGNPSATIQFGAAKALVFNHRYQLAFGTRFLGKLSGQPVRDRLNLAVETILYPDGVERPINATAVEADASGSNIRPGIAAYYFPPPQWAQVSPYLADFVTGYLGLLQSRAEQSLTANIGGVSLQTANAADPRAALYQASAQAIQVFTQARLKDIEQRYATHYLIPAGTACWLQLDRDLDLGSARESPPSAPAAPALPLSKEVTSK